MSVSESEPKRVLLGAFGDPGHAFPMIALGRALAARGHEVTLQTWRRWRPQVEAEGLAFAPAPEYAVFPSGPEPLDFYEAVVHATADPRPLVRELRPHVPAADVELPPGDAPLVLVAPSTAQDAEHRLLTAALRGLADEPVRVLATWNRRLPPQPLPAPANASLVPWVSYARTMPQCDVVVC